jgi:hypothetical protein
MVLPKPCNITWLTVTEGDQRVASPLCPQLPLLEEYRVTFYKSSYVIVVVSYRIKSPSALHLH